MSRASVSWVKRATQRRKRGTQNFIQLVIHDTSCFCDTSNKYHGFIACQILFFFGHDSPQCARASSLSRLHNHTQTHHTRQDFFGRVISSSQRPLPDNTQNSQQTDIHAHRIASKGATTQPCFRPVFLNRRAAPQYRALTSIIPGRERFSWNLQFQFSKQFS